MKSIKTGYKLSSAALTAVVIAAVILLNALVSAISDKVPLQLDLTKERIYEFSEQTNKIIKAIDEEVKVYALYPESVSSEYLEYAREYLAKYSRLNKNIEVTYIDPYENPAFAKKYEKTGETINAGSIIVEAGDRFKVVTLDQLYTQSSYTGSVSIDMEKKMTLAFSYVTMQGADGRIYFTEGHDEQSANGMKTALEGEGYTCEDVNIGMNGIADDASVVVIASPSKDFTGDEVNILDEYMDKGGRLIYVSTPGIPALEKLYSYFGEWGITPNNDMVIETSSSRAYGSGSGMPIPAPELKEHDINTNIINGGLVFMAPYSGSFTLSESNIRGASPASLLVTSDEAYGKTNLSSETVDKESGDIDGPLNVAAISEMLDETGSKLLVIGSLYSMEYNGILEEASYANGDFLLNAVAYMTENSNPLDIRAKVISSSTLTMNQMQIIVCYIILQYLIPILIIAAGLAVWLRRRYL